MENKNIYSNYSKINDGIKADFDLSYYNKTAAEYHQLYSNYLPVDKNANILDIGCGNGIFLYYLKSKEYKNYFGIDEDNSSLDIVRKNVTDKVLQGNALSFLNEIQEQYDLIIMNEVLEHIPKEDIVPLISLIYRSLKPGGTYISYVPNMENPFTSYTRYHDFTHTIGFTQNSLRMVMRAGGFTNVRVYAAVSPLKGLKRRIKKVLRKIVKVILVNLFEYPNDGFLHSMRIFSISKK